MLLERTRHTGDLAATAQASPPQTESISTPKVRAASSNWVCFGNSPRLPDGKKRTLTCSLDTYYALASATPSTTTTAASSLWGRLTVRLNPIRAIGVMPHHDIATSNRLHHLGMQWTGDCRSHTRAHCHGQERRIDAISVGQTKTDVGSTAGGVDLELRAQSPHELHHLYARLINSANRHHQRINDHILMRNSVVSSTLNNLLCHLKTHIGIFRDAGLVI